MSELKTYNKKIILVDKYIADTQHMPCVNRAIRLDNPRDLSEFYGTTLEEIIQLIQLNYPNSYMWIGGLSEDLPNEIISDGENYVREMTDKEKVEHKFRTLSDGEVIIDDKIIQYNTAEEKVVDGRVVKKTREEMIKDKVITLETEADKARMERSRALAALDLYDKAILRGDIKETPEMKEVRDKFRKDWLELPNKYSDITVPIEELYPEIPATIQYFMRGR